MRLSAVRCQSAPQTGKSTGYPTSSLMILVKDPSLGRLRLLAVVHYRMAVPFSKRFPSGFTSQMPTVPDPPWSMMDSDLMLTSKFPYSLREASYHGGSVSRSRYRRQRTTRPAADVGKRWLADFEADRRCPVEDRLAERALYSLLGSKNATRCSGVQTYVSSQQYPLNHGCPSTTRR